MNTAVFLNNGLRRISIGSAMVVRRPTGK